MEERIKQDSVKSNESNEWLDSAEVEDIFTDTKAKYTMIDDDDFFTSSEGLIEEFEESPKVSIVEVDELPLCSDLSDIEIEIGVKCFNEKRNRDEVLEKILKQIWETLDVSISPLL